MTTGGGAPRQPAAFFAGRTGQWLAPPDGRVWWFDSGALCLDFGYTGDYGYGVPAWEQLHSAADLDTWLGERFGPPARSSTARDYREALRLREAITATARRATEGLPPTPAAVDVINDWAAHPAIPPHLPGGTHGPAPVAPAQMLATVAHDAIQTFTGPAGRVRECAAEDCRLVFLDTSRPGSRRWCSMSRCGGRAKARSHYARNHEDA